MYSALRARKKSLGSKGFTILELLAVFAILAIIAAVAVPRYTTIVEKSEIQACKANIKMLSKAADMYHEIEKDWPSESEMFSAKYIDEFVYCPVVDEGGSPEAYVIDSETGAVTCPNGH